MLLLCTFTLQLNISLQPKPINKWRFNYPSSGSHGELYLAMSQLFPRRLGLGSAWE